MFLDIIKTIYHYHGFVGSGGGALGFNDANPRVGKMVGKFECLGGFDINSAAIRDFETKTGAKGTVMDLFTREQYIAFHGKEPDIHWREATLDDIRRSAGYKLPNIIFLSAPCKGFSGLLNETKSKTDKYQALNQLTLRGVWMMLEAWKDEPPELFVFENVPRIATRGRHLLDQITSLFHQYGYAVAETTHDCGELGGLSQSRKRFLLVARHIKKVPPFLYEPPKKSLQSVGTILGRMPLAGDIAGGPMHRIPNLQWKTWVRLAFVEAGSDWRSLNKLTVEDGVLRDYLIMPEYHNGYLGVNKWEQPSGVVAARSMPGNGNFSIADPRHSGPAKHSNEFRIVPYDRHAQAVTSAHGSGQAVADPRPDWENRYGNLAVMDWGKHSNTVIAGGKGVQGGYMSIQDPRPTNQRTKGDNYLTNGHYGVVPWKDHCGAVSAAAGHDNGKWSVADPRLPAANEKMVCTIRALDGTWHRPFTTLELAALQSYIEPEEYFVMDGMNDQEWRERIGNMVPRKAATAIAEVMGTTLLLAWSGETFVLSATPIWVQPIAIALSLSQEGLA